MILKNIKLTNYRNYEYLDLNFSSNINIIYGNNAQGKTNLLESIYVLAFTRSHRIFSDNNLIMKNKNKSNISGLLDTDGIDNYLKIELDENKKNIFVDNENIKKVSNYISKMNVIIFFPEDLFIIKGTPKDRRKFLDSEITQFVNGYYELINDYNKILKIRNDFLKKIHNKEKINEQYFNIINDYLIQKGSMIIKIRYKFISQINKYVEKIFYNIMRIKNFNIKYENCLNINSLDENIENIFKIRLEENYENDIKNGSTSVGPHRDDFSCCIGENSVKEYGSQGQQRIAIISFKLAELLLFKNNKKVNPILLLDDVFSELDERKKNNLLKYIDDNIQVIITTTDLNKIDNDLLKKSRKIKISNGKVISIREEKQNGRK